MVRQRRQHDLGLVMLNGKAPQLGELFFSWQVCFVQNMDDPSQATLTSKPCKQLEYWIYSAN